MRDILGGFAIGATNALFGAGGGMICVPYLKKSGLSVKKAHATSVAVILPISFISACVYYFRGSIDISQCLLYIPGGLLGAAAGALILKKAPDFLMKKLFALLIIYSAIKMLL